MNDAKNRPSEFDLIEELFVPLAKSHAGAAELKDDCATLSVSRGYEALYSMDTLVEGVHFFKDDPANLIAKKLLRVSLSDLAASGGYYIALAGDEIIAHPTSLIGSIGVIALKVNMENLMEKIGVEWEIVKSGDKKDFMSPFRSFTVEEKKLFQNTIDNFHTRFVTIIAENRKELDIDEVKPLADGRVFDSKQAMDLNLIDGIGYISDTVERIRLKLENPNLKVITYHRQGDYKSNLYSFSPQPPAFNLINLDLGLDKSTLSPHFLYLWMP